MIISASRRTDIPAFFSEWFLHRLCEGFVFVQNPYNKKQITKIMLSPDTVDCLVFWSKNPLPMFHRLPQIDALGYKYYFEFTLTPYGRDLEPGLPSKNTLLETFRRLSSYSKIIWRYDPIILTNKYSVEFHCTMFAKMAEVLCKYTDKCIFSFVDIYSKLKTSSLSAPSVQQMHEIAKNFAGIAKNYNIQLSTCCEQEDFTLYGIQAASCINKEFVERTIGCQINCSKDTGQRSLCNCVESIDIGMYDSCVHGCTYCYANQNFARAQKNMLLHDPHSPLLLGRMNDATIKEKKLISFKSNNISLF